MRKTYEQPSNQDSCFGHPVAVSARDTTVLVAHTALAPATECGQRCAIIRTHHDAAIRGKDMPSHTHRIRSASVFPRSTEARAELENHAYSDTGPVIVARRVRSRKRVEDDGLSLATRNVLHLRSRVLLVQL